MAPVNYYNISSSNRDVDIDYDALDKDPQVLMENHLLLEEEPGYKLYIDTKGRIVEVKTKDIGEPRCVTLDRLSCCYGKQYIKTKILDNSARKYAIGIITMYAVPLPTGGYLNIARTMTGNIEDSQVYYRSGDNDDPQSGCLPLMKALEKWLV